MHGDVHVVIDGGRIRVYSVIFRGVTGLNLFCRSVVRSVRYSVRRSVQALSVDCSVVNSVYISVLFPDPPPAKLVLLTDDIVEAKINQLLTDDKYNEILKLNVNAMEEEDLRRAEKLRSERAKYETPNVVEQKIGKGKRKSE